MPTSAQIFAQYPNAVFIETGSHAGEGIQAALDAGFRHVISIELAEKYYKLCLDRFVNRPEVQLLFGDTEVLMPQILEHLEEPATFWLDGHHSCDDTALGKHWAPLMQELSAIAKHSIRTHTILIDDMRCWQEPNPVHGFWKEDIFRILKEINPNYRLVYHDGAYPNDVLACVV